MHKALYRVYRPKHFDEILGQDAVISVLKNQLEEGNLSHAYLFCGPRGTGKTSTAKILAKAVNCIGDNTPCYTCEKCLESDIDVLELDAASNNSVDDIREIRENVVFTPVVGRYKIYIIDEVHMLSSGAANALLKTLEEPPQHVIFILATTEPHKIPATVLSRCQRFDFKQVEETLMVHLLGNVLAKEERTGEKEALEFIAQKSGGAVRDALSLLDKAMSYGELTLENVLEALGDVEEEVYNEFLRSCADKDIPRALKILKRVEEKGIDSKAFVRHLVLYMKEDLLNLMDSKEAMLEGATSDKTHMSADELGQWMEDFCSIAGELRFASMPQIQLEIQVVRLIHMGALNDDKAQIRMLKQQVDELKSYISQGASMPRPIATKAEAPAKPLDIPTENSIEPEQQKEKPENLPDVSPGEMVTFDVEELRGKMPEVLEELRMQKKISTRALLIPSRVHDISGDVLTLAFPGKESFHRVQLSQREGEEEARRAWSKVLDREIQLHLVDEEDIVIPFDPKFDPTLKILQKEFSQTPIEILKE